MSDEVVIVGKTNVGKSLLFNKLIGQKKSLVINHHGVTRDVMSGVIQTDEGYFVRLHDTGGFQTDIDDEIYAKTKSKIIDQISNSKLILFVVSAKDEINSIELEILKLIRKKNKKIVLVINKADLLKKNEYPSYYFTLGIDDTFLTSAKENHGINNLKDIIEKNIQPIKYQEKSNNNIIFLGQPNSGKSTLINTLIRDEKIITSNHAGSTVDVIENKFNYRNNSFDLLDTAGIMKKSQTKSTLKKYSINNTINHLDESDLCILIIDGNEKLSKQDKTLAELVHAHRVPYFIVVNKIDLIDDKNMKKFKNSMEIFNQIMPNTPIVYASALKNKNTKGIKERMYVMIKTINKEYKTSFLNKILSEAIAKHQPPLIDNKRTRLKFAKQIKSKHLTIEISGSKVDKLPKTYTKYLVNYFTLRLKIEGIPLRIIFTNQKNPFI